MIVWLRHGQSTWNAAGRLQGSIGHPPLTELGRRQASEVAERLAELRIEHIVSSPAVRARQTATIVAARLGLAVDLDPRLTEQGLTEPDELVADRSRAAVADLPSDARVLVVSHGDVIAIATGKGGVLENCKFVVVEPDAEPSGRAPAE